MKIKLEYLMEKLVGFEYNEIRYFYERNIQGNVYESIVRKTLH